MTKEPTAEQSRKALEILLSKSDKGFTAKFVTQAERERLVFKDNPERAWHLMPAFIVDSRYWCGWDVYFGHDIVIDLVAKVAHTSTRGIFHDDFVFISDYYGYPKGRFYYHA